MKNGLFSRAADKLDEIRDPRLKRVVQLEYDYLDTLFAQGCKEARKARNANKVDQGPSSTFETFKEGIRSQKFTERELLCKMLDMEWADINRVEREAEAYNPGTLEDKQATDTVISLLLEAKEAKSEADKIEQAAELIEKEMYEQVNEVLRSIHNPFFGEWVKKLYKKMPDLYNHSLTDTKKAPRLPGRKGDAVYFECS